jgi:hypothetical protein
LEWEEIEKNENEKEKNWESNKRDRERKKEKEKKVQRDVERWKTLSLIGRVKERERGRK